MRGKNITNVYIIDGKEISINDITKDQLLFIESNENRSLYNDFRNRVLVEKGDDVVCAIKIRIPEMIFEAENEFGILL
jgi:hypothetical protein